VVAVLLGAVAVLVLLSLGTRYAAYRADVAASGSTRAAGWLSLMKLFDVNSETNVPAWFSAALLLAAAAVTALVAVLTRRVGGRDPGRWLALAGVLGLMSVDEATALHERLGGPAAVVLGDAGGRFPWVVPGVLIAGVTGVFFLGFLVRLPPPIRRQLLGAGAVFLAGAVVLEAVSGAVLDAQGDRAAYLLVTAAEESLEMLGAIWLLCAALSCLELTADSAAGYRVTLRPELRPAQRQRVPA
jgi:hypothetical protein